MNGIVAGLHIQGEIDIMKVCCIEACEKPVKARNLCAMHHQRLMRHGDPLIVKPTRTKKVIACKWINCKREAVTRGYCDKHYYISRVAYKHSAANGDEV